MNKPDNIEKGHAVAVGSSAWLGSVVSSWRAIARRAFDDATHEINPMGKKIIEMKAMCYANCANQLESLTSPESHVSPTLSKYRKSKKRQT